MGNGSSLNEDEEVSALFESLTMGECNYPKELENEFAESGRKMKEELYHELKNCFITNKHKSKTRSIPKYQLTKEEKQHLANLYSLSLGKGASTNRDVAIHKNVEKQESEKEEEADENQNEKLQNFVEDLYKSITKPFVHQKID